MRQYSERWRLINDLPATGAWNMAVDEAIMISAGAGDALPTLRFYDWSPACLSLGYGQRVAIVDYDRLEAAKLGIVRRPTGGGAILHIEEVTYSVVLPADHELAKGSIVESYRRISAALTAGLSLLGVKIQADSPDGVIEQPAACFETPSHYEPTVQGKKLIGSAQARKYNAVLQHGSIPLKGDIARIYDVLAYDTGNERERAKENLRLRACTLTDALDGRIKTYQQVAEALAQGFESVLGITFEGAGLSKKEAACAGELSCEKYGQESWTARR